MALLGGDLDSGEISSIRRLVSQALREGLGTVRGETIEAEDSTGAVAVQLAGDGRFQAGQCFGIQPEDLTARAGDITGEIANHDGTDGTNVNAEGPAFYTSGGSWKSLVDGGTIA